MSHSNVARMGTLGQRVALVASLWVAASLAVAVAMFWWQAGQVGGLAGFNLVLMVPALGFAATSFGLRTLRWHIFLGAAGAHPPLLTSLRTQLIGFSLTMTPGKVGELYKCYLIEQHTGVPTARTAPIVLFEKMMDALAFTSLALLAAALLPALSDGTAAGLRSLAILALIAVAVAVALKSVSPEGVARFMLRLVGQSRFARRFASIALLALSGSIDLLSGPILARNLALGLAARTCDGLALAWAAWALGIDLPAIAGVFALNSAGAMGGLSMLPGGIGVVEATMTVVLGAFGAPPAAAFAATLAARLLTFWLWVAIGLFLLVRSGLALERLDP